MRVSTDKKMEENMSSSRKIAKIEGYEDEDMKNIIKCLEKQGFLVSEYDELDDDYKFGTF